VGHKGHEPEDDNEGEDGNNDDIHGSPP
jgi:hypothetical protein